jgi:hypothetical protein
MAQKGQDGSTPERRGGEGMLLGIVDVFGPKPESELESAGIEKLDKLCKDVQRGGSEQIYVDPV